MNLHEYQAKELLRAEGAPVADGAPARSLAEAQSAAKKLASWPLAVKAQIHAGGRGKGGGIALVHDQSALTREVERILGMVLVTPQTGAQGRKVRSVYIECGADIAREIYLSLLVDRRSGRPAFIVSGEGGMAIEELAASQPDKITTMPVDILTGWHNFHGQILATALGLDAALGKSFSAVCRTLYQAFIRHDMSLLEINPLVITKQNEIVCLDAKITLDDNALFRHPELAALHDKAEDDPAEAEAGQYGLNYIQLDGNVGCLVNGAGLAMATMDAIAAEGGQPANFLDVGGGAERETIGQAFRILSSSANVKAILVNIFGGIMRCDIIAGGILDALAGKPLPVPLVVRLAGTNAQQGQDLLARSGCDVITAADLGEAAAKAVQAAQKT